MKINKTVTENVIEANRRNAGKSTGPKTAKGKSITRHNAVQHGLLAKQILLRHDEVRQEELRRVLDDLENDYKPEGIVEQMLVEEIGTCWWKLRTATRLEFREHRNHRSASKQVIAELQAAGFDLKFFDNERSDTTPWGCEKVVVRHSKHNSHLEEKPADVNAFLGGSAVTNHDTGCLEIEATLTSFLPTILRYETSLKRDYYKAIQTLRDLQERRLEGQRTRGKTASLVSTNGILRKEPTKAH